VALARIDLLTGGALAQAAVRSPTVVFGVIGILAALGFGLNERVRSMGLDPQTASVVGLALGLAVAAGVAARAQQALEGPFGFVLVRPVQMIVLVLRRAGGVLAALLTGLMAVVGLARPEILPMFAATVVPGAVLGGIGGACLGLVWARAGSGQLAGGAALSRVRHLGSRLRQVVPSAILLALALQARMLGADTPSQLLAVAGAVAGVIVVLPVDPRWLNLMGKAPQSMSWLILPLALPPALVGVFCGVVAGVITGAAPQLVGLTVLVLSGVGVVARIFLALAALGRTDAGARTAGTTELALALLLPIAGPLAIGSAALIWIGGRLVWLWRRGRRVRWLDPASDR